MSQWCRDRNRNWPRSVFWGRFSRFVPLKVPPIDESPQKHNTTPSLKIVATSARSRSKLPVIGPGGWGEPIHRACPPAIEWTQKRERLNSVNQVNQSTNFRARVAPSKWGVKLPLPGVRGRGEPIRHASHVRPRLILQCSRATVNRCGGSHYSMNTLTTALVNNIRCSS